MTQTLSKTRMTETGEVVIKQDQEELPMKTARENSNFGSMFDLMTQTLYSKRTFANEPEATHAVRCALRIRELKLDDTILVAMLCHKLIRHTPKPHLQVMMELAQSTNYELAKLVEGSSFIPQAEAPAEYLDKLHHFVGIDWRILAIIATDWEDQLIVIRSGKTYRQSSEIKLMKEILPLIEQDWQYWRDYIPTDQQPKLDELWNNVFLLLNKGEII